jgi:hypothetical protein
MKEIFLVDAYLDKEKSIKVFKEGIRNIKNAGYEVFMVTNLRPTPDILELVDYCFFDKENRKFTTEFEEYPVIGVFNKANRMEITSHSHHKQKHSLSVHVNFTRSLEIIKSLGYTHVFKMEYDAWISPMDVHVLKEIPGRLGDKKALFYLDVNNKHVFYHLWYGEVQWMMDNITPIRSEEDYINRVVELTGKKKFLPAEEYLAADLVGKEEEILLIESVRDSVNYEFPNTRWNNVVSDHTNEKFRKGFYGGIFRVATRTPEGLHIRGDKAAVIAWNISSLEKNWVDVKFYNKEGAVEGETRIEVEAGWKAQFIEFTEDCEVEIKLSNGDSNNFLLCKDFLAKTTDTIIIHEDSADQSGNSSNPA